MQIFLKLDWIVTFTIHVYFRRTYMESSENNATYVSPPICTNRLILTKWKFFILFFLNMPTFPMISQNLVFVTLWLLFSIRLLQVFWSKLRVLAKKRQFSIFVVKNFCTQGNAKTSLFTLYVLSFNVNIIIQSALFCCVYDDKEKVKTKIQQWSKLKTKLENVKTTKTLEQSFKLFSDVYLNHSGFWNW